MGSPDPKMRARRGDHSLRVTETDAHQQRLAYSTYRYRTIAKETPLPACRSEGSGRALSQRTRERTLWEDSLQEGTDSTS